VSDFDNKVCDDLIDVID